jgi:hypothetical protein
LTDAAQKCKVKADAIGNNQGRATVAMVLDHCKKYRVAALGQGDVTSLARGTESTTTTRTRVFFNNIIVIITQHAATCSNLQ